jgi:GNAT superfamily N-acetyltransferase
MIDATDAPTPGTYEAIFQALDACSSNLIGPAKPRALVIPIRDDADVVRGGLWGCTMFEWLHVQMLVVPESLRGQGIGSALMALAEMEAKARGCRGMHVDTFSFQAEAFYRKLGFSLFGVLEDFPPGHKQLYFSKQFEAVSELA